jgi:hypothetical protein
VNARSVVASWWREYEETEAIIANTILIAEKMFFNIQPPKVFSYYLKMEALTDN